MDELHARIAFALAHLNVGERIEVHALHPFDPAAQGDETLHLDEGVFMVYVASGDTSEGVWRNPQTNELEFCG